MNDVSARKATIRHAALARRDAIPETRRIEAAMALAEHVEALEALPGAVVSAYWPIRSEIDPRPLLFALHERGCRMALPAIVDDAIVFRELVRAGELAPAGFGTMAPPADAPVLAPDLVLLPLAAFDGSGNRLGYGRGHYDAAIRALSEGGHAPRLVGLAYEAQQVEAIPAEPHDVRLDAVLSEGGLRPMSPANA